MSEAEYERKYHDLMDALKRSRWKHGDCKSGNRYNGIPKACTACMANRYLAEELKNYKGRPDHDSMIALILFLIIQPQLTATEAAQIAIQKTAEHDDRIMQIEQDMTRHKHGTSDETMNTIGELTGRIGQLETQVAQIEQHEHEPIPPDNSSVMPVILGLTIAAMFAAVLFCFWMAWKTSRGKA